MNDSGLVHKLTNSIGNISNDRSIQRQILEITNDTTINRDLRRCLSIRERESLDPLAVGEFFLAMNRWYLKVKRVLTNPVQVKRAH